MPRKDPLTNEQVYHVMNKSIAGYKIFNSTKDYRRMIQLIRYFMFSANLPKFSEFLESVYVAKRGFEPALMEAVGEEEPTVQIISYCLMPTHIHLVVKQRREEGISSFMSNILNSYTRYFNTKHKRKGPLWVGRFKSVLVRTDEQLLHLTRYLHLNPTTAELVRKPKEWQSSSYHEYVSPREVPFPLCEYQDLLEINPKEYRDFIDDQISYQRELGHIKKLILE